MNKKLVLLKMLITVLCFLLFISMLASNISAFAYEIDSNNNNSQIESSTLLDNQMAIDVAAHNDIIAVQSENYLTFIDAELSKKIQIF